MARQLSFLDVLSLDSQLDFETTRDAFQHRDEHAADIATLLSPGGELWHWVTHSPSRPDIGDIFKQLADASDNQSTPPDWVNDLPTPASLQGIVTENILDLIHDVREALPDQTQDWPSWLQNPANLQAVKSIVVDHVQDLIHDVRGTLPEELHDWSGWSDLGKAPPHLGSIGDQLGDIGHVLQAVDASHLEPWHDAAQATFETIKDAAEDQFGNLGSLGDILSHGNHGHGIFEDFFDFRHDGAITPDL